MYSYTFTKNGIIYLDLFNKYIGTLFNTTVTSMYENNLINIVFNFQLTSQDEILLETSVNNYVSPQNNIIMSSSEQLNLLYNKCKTLDYSIICINNYNKGIRDFQNNKLKEIQINTCINNNINNYSLRAYDINNKIVLGELINLNNTNIESKVINIGNINDSIIIEIQCKVSSGICTINSCNFIYINN